jgi:hypothetical protein
LWYFRGWPSVIQAYLTGVGSRMAHQNGGRATLDAAGSFLVIL